MWVGSQNGLDADLVRNASTVNFVDIPSAGLHGVGLRTLPSNAMKLINGFLESKKIIKSFQPHVIFFTGGYVAVPMSLAASSVPQVVFVPDIEPALALRQITRSAQKIALSVPESKQYFKKNKAKLTITGYPTRMRFANINKADAVKAFGISESSSTVLVFGGSRGARSINHALLGILPDLIDSVQIIHISGELDWPMVSDYYAGMSQTARRNYFPYPYLHRKMPHAMRAADLVVSRAGASTIGEYPMLGLPAILVPYPHAWKYQKHNADYLVDQGAAMLLPDEELPQKLLPSILGLIHNPEKLIEMKTNMLQLARPDAATEIVKLITDIQANKERKS